MRSLTVNFKDDHGGAARAAYRIHKALGFAGVESRMLVREKSIDDWTIDAPTGTMAKLSVRARPRIGNFVMHTLSNTTSQNYWSLALLPSSFPDLINRTDADVVHLHWICEEMMSVEDIARIRKPIVWTLHDMWPFCGIEHYTEDTRWRDGYLAENRPSQERGLDLSRWVWNRKRRAWKAPMAIVAPSRWLAGCARESLLMRGWQVETIHNALDTDAWTPIPVQQARALLHLPSEAKLLLFGAIGGGSDPRKGLDLLFAALAHLRGQVAGLELIVFGQGKPMTSPDLGFPIHWTGHLHDELSLRVLYCAADAMLITSRQDNLPNTGVEALACGRPVVAFDVGGLPDIVRHRQTGWLAKAFDAQDLAHGIGWILADVQRHAAMCAAARADAVRRFAYPAVAAQYRSLYERVCGSAGD